ncbi:MAG: hypothetical protein CL398_05325 [Acidiferrobacteraceae bacterium]|nr:hypothetical protein [Acidiferrobacteraceae bacterium]|tara:strand:- start:2494 stop:3627 length:1134 start_codon:yes stop_codon:yes gene_type:complete
MAEILNIGLIINPIAGMGGKVGLKGTDGSNMIERALDLGATQEAGARTERALGYITDLKAKFNILTCSGVMGEDVCKTLDLEPIIVNYSDNRLTTSFDTIRTVRRLIEANVDLIIFAGGDGTAYDVWSSLNSQTPILGIPTGVKMHSAVFGNSPQAVGQLLARILRKSPYLIRVKPSEIMDVDQALRDSQNSEATLLGYAQVPFDRLLIQNPKSYVPIDEDASIIGIAEYLKHAIDEETYYIVGPGRTTKLFLQELGIDGTLLGVDLLYGKSLIGKDLTHKQLKGEIKSKPVSIIIGVIGGQGFLFGRGNQQITADIVRRAGKDRIIVIAAADKLLSLDNQRLLVDTGDEALNAELQGYIRVRTGKRDTMIIKLEAA